MATPQQRNGSWRIIFSHGGRQHSFTLGRVDEAEAEAVARRVDYLLMRLKQGLASVPPGVPIAEYMRLDGAPAAPAAAPFTMGDLKARYLAAHEGKLERETMRGYRRHLDHLERLLGRKKILAGMAKADLQGYVDARLREKWRGGTVGPQTPRKELVTFRAAWNWAAGEGLVDGVCPTRGVRYPKVDEKPPYMSRAEIERTARGLDEASVAELWEALYLTADELRDFLEQVRAGAAHPWIHPLAATAAHAGLRRSELARMTVGDVDFDAGVVVVRERKRSHARRTTRRIPMSSELRAALLAWLEVHPGGPQLFAQAEVVERSRKRSARTGWKSKGRATTDAGRAAETVERPAAGVQPLTVDEIHYHFKATLAGTKWSVVRGLHVLRHSFISALASRGVDQRLIDEFAGHSTEEQRRRYRHLHPGVQADAIRRTFG